MYNPYQQSQNYSNGIVWCQGESGAKSYPVQPGTTVALFDSEENCVYIKTVDVMGRPLPLKILDYKERTTVIEDQKSYIEKDSFDETITSFNEKLDEVINLLTKTSEKTTEKVVKEKKSDAK